MDRLGQRGDDHRIGFLPDLDEHIEMVTEALTELFGEGAGADGVGFPVFVVEDEAVGTAAGGEIPDQAFEAVRGDHMTLWYEYRLID